MCYIGGAEIYTSFHKNTCVSFGHNLMCCADSGRLAQWYMTSTQNYHQASLFFYHLSLEIDWECHLLVSAELARASFCVFMVECRGRSLALHIFPYF